MANFMHGQFGAPGENLVGVRTKGGRDLTVNAAGAENFKGFVEELEAKGAPLGDIGSYSKRAIRGGSGWSQHAYGNALDLFNQSGMNEISPEGHAWLSTHQQDWREALGRWGMESGEDWHRRPDLGHVEWTGAAPPTDITGAQIAARIASRLSDGGDGGVRTARDPAAGSQGPLTTDSTGRFVDPIATYQRAIDMFEHSPLKGYVPADAADWGIKTGSPQEWARLAMGTIQQESGFNVGSTGLKGENSWGITQMARGEYGIRDPFDPEQALQGMVNQWSQYIPASGYIAGRGTGPGTSDGYRGAAAYFGSFRRPSEVGQYVWSRGGFPAWVDQKIAAAGPATPPKVGTQAYWESTRARPQVAQAQPTPRSEPKPGSTEYWRGPKHGEQAQEATRIASARRSRGHAHGEGDADPNIPYAGSAMPPSSDFADSPLEATSYEGGGAVPGRVIIDITVARET